MSKPKPNCRWCRDGNVPDDRGDHWIVKSIFPSRVVIKRCLNLPKEEPADG